MTTELLILTGTAASVGFAHTILGPDHYLPFIFMAKARKWSNAKTAWITAACGIGHVGSSIVIGIIGIVFGFTMAKLELIEGVRGSIAAWGFTIFGLVYMIWGIWRAVKNKPHKHFHIHKDGTVHEHDHSHSDQHDHIHNKNITPWVLFTIFVLGPCEAMIPLLLFPASEKNYTGLIVVAIVFGLVTILTMLAVVMLSVYGLSFAYFGKMERYTHAIAGAIVLLSGIGILWLGL
jgi:ABC-type nickel/cobalt efflux system permease component RcnA